MNNLVSVIVTTKNNQTIIERCIRSITNQKNSPFELIVVDNHSTDRTASIARNFTQQVFSHGPERSAQRNRGAKKSKGNFLLFIDSDMELRQNTLKNCIEHINNHVALTIPETFIGKGFWTRCKILEKTCYTSTNDGVASRFFTKKAF